MGCGSAIFSLTCCGILNRGKERSWNNAARPSWSWQAVDGLIAYEKISAGKERRLNPIKVAEVVSQEGGQAADMVLEPPLEEALTIKCPLLPATNLASATEELIQRVLLLYRAI